MKCHTMYIYNVHAILKQAFDYLQEGLTALMLAASSGSSKLVYILLEAGADINAQDVVSVMYSTRQKQIPITGNGCPFQ